MLFSADSWPGIAAGDITVTFRTWSKPQAKTGGRYRVGGMLLEATDVRRVRVDEITDADAARSGAADRAAVLARLGGNASDVWRVEFRYLGADDRIVRGAAEPSDDDLDALRARLQRLDRGGAWTRQTLQLIQHYPGIVSTVLARHAGKERFAFKLEVRKLKELGLTESLTTGYRLTPLGERLLSDR